jgi:hypothetical protein
LAATSAETKSEREASTRKIPASGRESASLKGPLDRRRSDLSTVPTGEKEAPLARSTDTTSSAEAECSPQRTQYASVSVFLFPHRGQVFDSGATRNSSKTGEPKH